MLHKSPTFFEICGNFLSPAAWQVHSGAVPPVNQSFSAVAKRLVKDLAGAVVKFL
jgi:hypothetical protein